MLGGRKGSAKWVFRGGDWAHVNIHSAWTLAISSKAAPGRPSLIGVVPSDGSAATASCMSLNSFPIVGSQGIFFT